MPYEDGKVIFMGWDFYDDPDQNGGWDEAFSDVLEIGGAASTSTSQAFWETAGNDAQSNPFWVAGSPDLDGFFPDVL
jgi:hypothetical protein